jgi:hypothetical protein
MSPCVVILQVEQANLASVFCFGGFISISILEGKKKSWGMREKTESGIAEIRTGRDWWDKVRLHAAGAPAQSLPVLISGRIAGDWSAVQTHLDGQASGGFWGHPQQLANY